MPACNLNARGKAARLIGGVITLAVAAVLAALLTVGVITPAWVWFVVLGTTLGALFQLYEGWSGWCAINAMLGKSEV